MSGVIDWAEELSSYGLVGGPDRDVCARHFTDKSIKNFIRRNSFPGECEYCSNGKSVVDLEMLMKFLMNAVLHFYTDPADFSPWDGEYYVDHQTSWEILTDKFELDVDVNNLFEDMSNWTDPNEAWADSNKFHGDGQYARPNSWNHFSYLVKHEVRYLFHLYIDDDSHVRPKPAEILNDVGKMVKKYKLLTLIPKGKKVYRCRQHDINEKVTKVEQICAPEIKFCKNPNRFSPAGISMFYCAESLQTTLKETIDTNWAHSNYTTGEFSTKNDLKVIDLSNLPNYPSVFNENKRKMYDDLFFLNAFIKDLTRTFSKDSAVHIDYVPTQVVTEYFKYMFKGEVDGIIYPSAQNKGQTAMVLFYDHYDSKHYLDLNIKSLKTRSVKSYIGNI